MPRRTLLDWPSDVVELADALALERFGITALSGGGIYALACAAAIPERLTNVVVTGCPGAMDRPGAFDGMRLVNRVGLRVATRAPWLLEAGSVLLAGLVRRYPAFVLDQANRDKPAPDRRWLLRPEVRAAAVATLREAVRAGARGYLDDVLLLARPWPFAPERIRVPIELWHGDLDTVIPLHHGRYLAAAIPGARLRVCAGEAHMLMWNHLPEILLAAAGLPPAARPAAA